MKNPLITASGTCGYGREMAELFDLSILGGISVKGTTLEPRLGNKPVSYTHLDVYKRQA